MDNETLLGKGILLKSIDNEGYYFMLKDVTKSFQNVKTGWCYPQIHLKSLTQTSAIEELESLTDIEIVDDIYFQC